MSESWTASIGCARASRTRTLGFMAAMCVAEPAPTQTMSWASRFWSISTRSTFGSGKGATEPGAKPVASSTSAPARDARLGRAGGERRSSSRSTRRSPGTSATTGRPSQRTTIDLTIWPIGQPAARAASSAVAVPDSSSSSLASAPAARRYAATRSTGSGQLSRTQAKVTASRRAPEPEGSPLSSSTASGRRETPLNSSEGEKIARTESLFREVNERIAEYGRAVRRRRDEVRLRVRRPDVHPPRRGDARGVRASPRGRGDLPPRQRARGRADRSGRARRTATAPSSRSGTRSWRRSPAS